MTHVEVKPLTEGEGRRVVVEGDVDGCIADEDVLVVDTGDEFLEVTDTLSSSDRAPESVVIVLLKVSTPYLDYMYTHIFKIQGILEPFPFALGEQSAKVTRSCLSASSITRRLTESCILVRTDLHHRVRVIGVERVGPVNEVIIQSLGGIVEEAGSDELEDCVVTGRTDSSDNVVQAAIVRSEGVVLSSSVGQPVVVVGTLLTSVPPSGITSKSYFDVAFSGPKNPSHKFDLFKVNSPFPQARALSSILSWLVVRKSGFGRAVPLVKVAL